MSARKRAEGMDRFHIIVFDVSDEKDCRMKCRVCYKRGARPNTASPEELGSFCKRAAGKIILLSGGEPTLNRGLPAMIRAIGRSNTCFLVTNGIRLSDSSYADTLYDAHLSYVSFSANYMSGSGGREAAALKRKKEAALWNLQRRGIQVLLSFYLQKGVNEQELAGLFNYALENPGFAREIRIRSIAPFGEYQDAGKLGIREMLGIACRKAGVSAPDVLKELEFQAMANRCFGQIFSSSPCKLNFHLRIRDGRLVPVFSGADISGIEKSRLPGLALLAAGKRAYGSSMIFHGAARHAHGRKAGPWFHPPDIIKVGIRSWRDGSDFDSEAERQCRTGLYMGGSVVPFCKGNILLSKGGHAI